MIEYSLSLCRARPLGTALACGLGLIARDPACGQAASADILVIGARQDTTLAKLPAPLLDTPQSISVVTEEELQARAATTLTDALRVIPGISIGAGETSWQGNNLILRGFTTRNDTFLDGMRDYGYYYRDPFFLESVEVLKGPSSVLFGRGTTGGVIHQVGKRPKAEAAYAATLSAGTDDVRRAVADMNMPVGGGASVRAAAMLHRSGVADRDGALARRAGVAPSLALPLGAATRLTLAYLHQEEDNRPDYGIPWFAGRPARVDRNSFYGFADDYLDTNVDIGTARIEHDVSDRLQLRGQVRYSDNRRAFRTSEAVVPAGTPVIRPLEQIRVDRNVFSGFSHDRFLQGQADLTARFAAGGIGHVLVAGVERGRERPCPTYIFHEGVIGTSLVDPPPQAFAGTRSYVRLRARARAETAGAYAIDTLSFGPSWLATVALRWDRFAVDYASTGFASSGASTASTAYRRVDRKVSGRAALVHKPAADASLYVSYGTSFNPSAEGIESLISAGRTVAQANLRAAPETGRMLEAGGKWSLLSGRLLLTGAAFEIVKSNVRIPDPAVAGFNANGGRQRVRGVEVEIVGRVGDRLGVRAGYALLDSATTRSDNPAAAGGPRIGEALTITPQHSVSVQAGYALTSALEIGGTMLYQSSRLGQNTNSSLLRAPGYVVFDARLAYRVAKRATLQLNVYNLTDKLYYDQLHPFHVVPGAGRSALLGLRFG